MKKEYLYKILQYAIVNGYKINNKYDIDSIFIENDFSITFTYTSYLEDDMPSEHIAKTNIEKLLENDFFVKALSKKIKESYLKNENEDIDDDLAFKIMKGVVFAYIKNFNINNLETFYNAFFNE